MKVSRILIALSALALGVVAAAPKAVAQDQCVPFGGTIYGWHSDAWYGVGDFTVGKNVMHATVADPNTGLTDMGDTWLGTEEATFTFANGDKITAMTEFITEHMTDPGGAQGVIHVDETGYFSKGTGRFKNAWGRFNLQGPAGPGVKLPATITPDANDGFFWIGQYNGTICGVSGLDTKKEKD
jgi:hypothetical protein